MWKTSRPASGQRDFRAIIALLLEWPSKKPQLWAYIAESSLLSPEDVPSSGTVRGAGGGEVLLLESDQQLLSDHLPGYSEWLRSPVPVRDHGFRVHFPSHFCLVQHELLPSQIWEGNNTHVSKCRNIESLQNPVLLRLEKISLSSLFKILLLWNTSNIQKAQRIIKQIPMNLPQRVNNC